MRCVAVCSNLGTHYLDLYLQNETKIMDQQDSADCLTIIQSVGTVRNFKHLEPCYHAEDGYTASGVSVGYTLKSVYGPPFRGGPKDSKAMLSTFLACRAWDRHCVTCHRAEHGYTADERG